MAQNVAKTTSTPPPANAQPPSTPRRRAPSVVPLSPAPPTGKELEHCLTDLLKRRTIDLRDKLPALTSKKYTVEALADVDIDRLQSLLDIAEGEAVIVHKFVANWVARWEEKKRHHPRD